MRLSSVLLLASGALAACSGSTTSTPGTSGSSSGGTTADGGTTGEPSADADAGTSEPPASTEPTLAAIQSGIFGRSCAGGQCHGTAARGGLVLTSAAKSCADLVGIASVDDGPSMNCGTGGAAGAGLKRVVPGDPEASFLYLKVASPSQCVEVEGKAAGERMPKRAPLTAAQIAQIKGWIEAGAPCE